MKKVFLLFALMVCVCEINAQHFSPHITPHVSPVHATPHVSEPTHVSSSHGTPIKSVTVHETPMYHPIKTIDESHIYLNKNKALYYYLILNNHTCKHDTIYAKTKQQVSQKVIRATESGEEKFSKTIMVVGGSFLLLLLIVVLSTKKKSN